MKLYFSDEALPKEVTCSIFLAGPSPRDSETPDWRVQAVEILKKLNFKGEVLIPIPRNVFFKKSKESKFSYSNQIDWECNARHVSDKILFWIPRSIENKLPGFTTNVEFGEDLNSGKMIYGRPDDAEKCRYLDLRYKETEEPLFNNLENLLSYTVESLGEGAKRIDGEINIPLFIWKSEQFKVWYGNLLKAGNKLINAQLLSHFSVPNYENVFSFVLKVNIWVQKEKRFKVNEFISSRKNISTVVAYYPGSNGNEILFIKEFRSPVNNPIGYVTELPCGSSTNDLDPITNIKHELHEETGLEVDDINRFQYISTQQLVANLNTYQSHLYKLQLTKQEFYDLKEKEIKNPKSGNINESEITYITFINEKNIFKHHIDFAHIGMIHSALNKE